MSLSTKPKLRNVTIDKVIHDGQPVFLMRDSLRLTEAMIALPQFLGPLAMLCDGQHTIDEMRATLTQQYGLELPNGAITHLLTQLDEALLIEGETFEQAKAKAIAAYRHQPFRQPALADHSYPREAADIRRLFEGYLDSLDDIPISPASSRAIISPHIDYQRGGPVYAAVWASAEAAVREAELIIILATDHNGGLGTLTPTLQHYASPFGVMPTETEIVNQLADIVGPDRAFADELHHIGEHSIELVLLWLQFTRQNKSCPIVPILCGSFYRYMRHQADIKAESHFTALRHYLQEVMQQRRTVIVASGDLAHMGPAFDGPPLDAAAYQQMKDDDTELISTLADGNGMTFLEFMRGQYERNVCGLSPFYFTLDILEASRGELISYDRCPADANDTSYVSVCGMVLK